MSISNAAESAIMKLVFQAIAWANYADNAAVSPEANIAVALHTADPGDAGTLATSEVTYTGHSPADVWGYTPKRIAAFLRIAHRRIAREAAHNLSISALAARGDPKEIRRQHKELMRE